MSLNILLLELESRMSEKSIKEIEARILAIKGKLQNLEHFRPGSLTMQYKDSKNKEKPYWQISYTRARKSHTNHVKKEHLHIIEKQIANYQDFKNLIDEWINLEIELSKLHIKNANKSSISK